jgi:hypothetical protein
MKTLGQLVTMHIQSATLQLEELALLETVLILLA